MATSHSLRCRAAAAALAALLSLGARADSAPAWVGAAQVKATDTRCGEVRSLTLRKTGAAPAGPAGCVSTEMTYQHVFISAKFLRRGNDGPIAERDLDVRHVACAKEAPMLILGPEADTERALREHPAKAGCAPERRHYERVASEGSIPFASMSERQTMSIAESLAMHARERNQIIAECNASASCRAELNRMSSSSGKKSYTCPAGYILNGMPDNPYASCVRDSFGR